MLVIHVYHNDPIRGETLVCDASSVKRVLQKGKEPNNRFGRGGGMSEYWVLDK